MVKYNIIIYKKAEEDLDGIYNYIAYTNSSPESAKRKIKKIWDAIFSLENFPHSHQDRLLGKYGNKNFKQLIVNNYIVIFKINEETKTVYIYTVLHHGKNI